MTLALSQQGKQVVATLRANLPPAVLLTGPRGVGLKTIATRFGDTPRIIVPELQTKTSTIPQISIDTIRELYTDTRAKQTNSRVIVIDDADKMSLPAQNSFLKLLEEPTPHVHFILTSHHAERLLPTVRSRLQAYHLPALSPPETAQFIANLPSQSRDKQTQLLYIASGLPAELMRLIEDENYFEQAKSRMQIVRQILDNDRYSRTTAAMKITLDRNSTLELVEAAIDVLARQPSTSNVARMKQLLDGYQNIQNGGNIKLQLVRALA